MFSLLRRLNKKFNNDPIKNINIPILILNKDYHDIFLYLEKTEKLINIESRLSGLLKKQGQLNYDLKHYEKIKKQQMSKILNSTTEVFDQHNKNARREMKKSEKYIIEINNKLLEGQARLEQISYEIKKINSDLLEECVNIYYASMRESNERLKIVNDQIEKIRSVMKKKIEEKSIHEDRIEKTYSLLHKIVGPTIINKLDEENMEV